MSVPIEFALIIASIVIILPLMWVGIIFLTARFGGWEGLTEHYATSALPAKFNTRLIRLIVSPSWLRVTTYSKCVRLQIDDDAIYFAVSGIFGLFHKRLRMPLDDMRIIEKGQGHIKIVIGPSTEVYFDRIPSIHLSFRQTDFDWMEGLVGPLGSNFKS